MIIAVEGLDGVGKTRLAKSLAERIGAFYVRALDKNSKHLLLSTHDPDEQAKVVYASIAPKAAWCRKLHVICVFDRYAYSLAYQLAQGASPELIAELITKLPRPELLIIIHGGKADWLNVHPNIIYMYYNALLDLAPPHHVIHLPFEDATRMSVDELLVYAVRVVGCKMLERYISGVDVVDAALSMLAKEVVSLTMAARIAGMNVFEFIEEGLRRGVVVLTPRI